MKETFLGFTHLLPNFNFVIALSCLFQQNSNKIASHRKSKNICRNTSKIWKYRNIIYIFDNIYA